jgi:hypothetical protein
MSAVPHHIGAKMPGQAPSQAVGPYTAWPDDKGGYVVLDLPTNRPVAGPFPTPKEAIKEAARWNRRQQSGA